MHLHILGICGTFMGGIAAIAKAAGHTVSGCDANVYPPMSTQLATLDIALTEGWDPVQLDGIARNADAFVIGNVVSRGNPLMEAILDTSRPYISGPQWLFENVLRERWVLAVAGTHGKTTTSAMLAWILDYAGLAPGFLIGGIPLDFGISARLSGAQESPFFVIEADEYDTAFFDKRSKFVHYRPRTAILNNLEYDHADIFPDLGAIETQFHHLVRTIPGQGRLIVNGSEASVERVLARGVWSEVERFRYDNDYVGQGEWTITDDGIVAFAGIAQGVLRFFEAGRHNQLNALAAIAAARHAGVPVARSLSALTAFRGVKRRLETRGVVAGVTVYDDFAHHPTAIATTIDGLRRRIAGGRWDRSPAGTGSAPAHADQDVAGAGIAHGRTDRDIVEAGIAHSQTDADAARGRILAVLELRSNTMKLGAAKDALAGNLAHADRVFCYVANLGWNVADALQSLGPRAIVLDDLERLTDAVVAEAQPGDHILVMSNGGFGGIHDKLLDRLGAQAAARTGADTSITRNANRDRALTTKSATGSPSVSEAASTETKRT